MSELKGILNGVVRGTIINNTREKEVQEMEGITIVAIKNSYDNKYIILGGANNENHDRLMKCLHEQTRDFLGFEDTEEFKKAWSGDGIDGCFYLHKENLIDIKPMKLNKGDTAVENESRRE
ncbi:hypothetical protein [Vallitalea guaymasensis]|uniref:hypothetical protein n=1 Tax=Vallitalea guaymasensis TaxID=1185412 RepID=UPI000DE1D328|nr:hypothetical protein [Vallitalea guaymasensis]